MNRSERSQAGSASARHREPNAPSGRATDRAGVTLARRRASRSLWRAVEALLAASEPRAMNLALDALREAFEADGVAMHARAPSGELEPLCARGAWRTAPGDLRACLTLPLMRGDERVGTLDLRAPAGRSWNPTQLALVRTAAGALGAALGARLELQRLRRQPGRDTVTGLPDARTFHARLGEEMARSRRYGVPVAVVAVDLDRFGALNARHGRGAGDAVLAEAALVMRLAVRDSDLVARLGGDGFAVLLPETDGLPALRCAERIRRALEEHRFPRAGRISASAGVASGPRDGVEGVELLHQAERALAVAKKSGRRRVAGIPGTHVH